MVRWECGCVGVFVGNDPYVFMACDGGEDHETYGIWVRDDLRKKVSTPATPEQSERILKKLGVLVANGHRFEDIRRALGVPDRAAK